MESTRERHVTHVNDPPHYYYHGRRLTQLKLPNRSLKDIPCSLLIISHPPSVPPCHPATLRAYLISDSRVHRVSGYSVLIPSTYHTENKCQLPGLDLTSANVLIALQNYRLYTLHDSTQLSSIPPYQFAGLFPRFSVRLGV